MLRQVLFILFCVYDCELVKYHNKKIMNESKISVLKAGHILVNKSKDSFFFFKILKQFGISAKWFKNEDSIGPVLTSKQVS